MLEAVVAMKTSMPWITAITEISVVVERMIPSRVRKLRSLLARRESSATAAASIKDAVDRTCLLGYASRAAFVPLEIRWRRAADRPSAGTPRCEESVIMVVMRAVRLMMTVCALGLTAQAQYPGQYPGPYPPGGYPPGGYPPGGYPPGRYPGQGQPNGQPGPLGRRPRGGNPNAGAPTTTYGILRIAAGRQFVIESDDHRIITYKAGPNMSVEKDGKPAAISQFAPGDHLIVDATEDEQGYYTASAVRFDHAASEADAEHAAQTRRRSFRLGIIAGARSGRRPAGAAAPSRSLRRRFGQSAPGADESGRYSRSPPGDRNEASRSSLRSRRSRSAEAETRGAFVRPESAAGLGHPDGGGRSRATPSEGSGKLRPAGARPVPGRSVRGRSGHRESARGGRAVCRPVAELLLPADHHAL